MTYIQWVIGLISELLKKCNTLEEFQEAFNNAIDQKNDKKSD